MKIAFIAMSGLRAYNPELTRLGLTLPGFVERNRAIASLPSLSLLTLAAMTPDHFEVEYQEIADIRAVDTLPACDLAAIATFTAQVKDAYELADRYRSLGAKTVMGGLHVTALPEEASLHCDAVVVGEGELSWPALLRDFENGHLRRVYDPGGRQFDLREAPIPRFELLDPTKYNRLTIQTQRGCPWSCEFCASSIRLSPSYKLKPVHKVVEEIRRIKEIWPRPFIEFADDNTFVNKRHSKELMRAIVPGRVRWFTETDISVAEDADLLRLMRDAGCAQVLIGLESPTGAGLDGVELRRNWKSKQLDSYEAAIERIQSAGITVNGCFVLGLDGDSVDVFDEVWNFVRRTGLYEVQITVLTAFPGTPLYTRLRSEGRLIEESAWEKCTSFDVNVRPKQMSREELGKRLYSAESKKERADRFRSGLRRRLSAGRGDRS